MKNAVIGRTTTFDRMYPVVTQLISCWVAPRLPAIWGSATLTMVVSSTSMIAAVMSPSRMSQRVLPDPLGLAGVRHRGGNGGGGRRLLYHVCRHVRPFPRTLVPPET